MATNTPIYHEDHYIGRDVDRSNAGTWLVVAAVIVLLALLLFGSNAFRENNTGTRGTVNTPGNLEGTVNTQ